MSPVFDQDRPGPHMQPLVLAKRVSDELIPEATERHRFMGLFRVTLAAEARGTDTWHTFRQALESGDALAMAAHIEAVAASRGMPTHQKPRTARQDGRPARRIELEPQQIQALADAAQGLTVEESATRMSMTPGSVSALRYAARNRLGARNTSHAVARAIAAGLIYITERNEDQ